jgi:hypothetical protein
MSLDRNIQERAAFAKPPPSAEIAKTMADEVGDLMAEMDTVRGKILEKATMTPGDRTEIAGLVVNLKTKAFAVYGKVLTASQAVEKSR